MEGERQKKKGIQISLKPGEKTRMRQKKKQTQERLMMKEEARVNRKKE